MCQVTPITYLCGCSAQRLERCDKQQPCEATTTTTSATSISLLVKCPTTNPHTGVHLPNHHGMWVYDRQRRWDDFFEKCFFPKLSTSDFPDLEDNIREKARARLVRLSEKRDTKLAELTAKTDTTDMYRAYDNWFHTEIVKPLFAKFKIKVSTRRTDMWIHGVVGPYHNRVRITLDDEEDKKKGKGRKMDVTIRYRH